MAHPSFLAAFILVISLAPAYSKKECLLTDMPLSNTLAGKTYQSSASCTVDRWTEKVSIRRWGILYLPKYPSGMSYPQPCRERLAIHFHRNEESAFITRILPAAIKKLKNEGGVKGTNDYESYESLCNKPPYRSIERFGAKDSREKSVKHLQRIARWIRIVRDEYCSASQHHKIMGIKAQNWRLKRIHSR